MTGTFLFQICNVPLARRNNSPALCAFVVVGFDLSTGTAFARAVQGK